MTRWHLLLAALLLATSSARAAEDPPAAGEVFNRRILPIFRSPDPSSCTQCHLAGVDLKNYILPSHEKTFLSLRDQGLIDLDNPKKSKILDLIQMREDQRKGANLIHEKQRLAEYQAFSDWIQACSKDAKLRAAPRMPEDQRAAPPRPEAVIRHARKDRLLSSFETSIWALRFRCHGCHSSEGAQYAKLSKKHGERMGWLKKDAGSTMDYLLGSRLINRDRPERSMLLLKPLAEEVEHGGGKKILPGDDSYKVYRRWLEDASAILTDRYRKAADLPAAPEGPAVFGSEIWLKLTDTPEAWGDRLLRVTLFAWDARARQWESKPIAVSDRGVWGKGKLWQHNLLLLADKGSAREKAWKSGRATLPPGRYRVKVHVDQDNRLGRDWTAQLGEESYAGEAEIDSRWPAGYGQMTAISAGRIRKTP